MKRPPLSNLKSSFNGFWGRTLLVCGAGLLAVQLLFFLLAIEQARNTTRMIRSFLSDSRVITNPYLFAQRMEDIEGHGLAKCSILQRANEENLPFIDLSFKSGCRNSTSLNQYLWIQEWGVVTTLPGIDGGQWTLRFHSVNSGYFLLGLWLSRVGFVGFVVLFRWYQRKLLGAEALRHEMERQSLQSFARLSSQVAHDIRSPLAALDIALRDLNQLPEETRMLVRNAVNRIADIANHLLRENRAQNAVPDVSARPSQAGEPLATQLISSLIDPIISEKRLQFRSRMDVRIEMELGPASYGLFAEVQPVEFQRLISNLINNSVEALSGAGIISVVVSGDESGVLIAVQDNGRGIAPEILPRLARLGETHGKPDGSGLGLYHARTSVERWGGTLNIESFPGPSPRSGTIIRIRLPRKAAPSWFVPRLQLQSGQSVAILDDDSAIHQVWRTRLEPLELGGRSNLELLHFSTPEIFREWFNESSTQSQHSLNLVDYELRGSPCTGIDLIEELGIAAKSILVTSRYEDRRIQERCERLGLRLIPKSMAGLVPLSVEQPPERPDAILIDDDELVRMTWQSSAKKVGRKLRTFASADDFLMQADRLSADSPVYVDSQLGEGKRGEEIAKLIFEKGFRTLYLATGYEPDHFPALPHIRAIVGKEPPWLARISHQEP